MYIGLVSDTLKEEHNRLGLKRHQKTRRSHSFCFQLHFGNCDEVDRFRGTVMAMKLIRTRLETHRKGTNNVPTMQTEPRRGLQAASNTGNEKPYSQTLST